ncbi:MAG: chemotaxis protein CheV [Magnetococcales bacterium]|nr:chemotaxis protein CheV [Magnetococcales bacterium]
MDNMMEEIAQRANLAFSNQMEMLTFYLTDNQQYGVNVFKIIEVIETPKAITKMPHSHPAVTGAIDFRDSMVTAIDLSVGLGMEPVDVANDISYIIICEYSGTTQGLLIKSPNKLINKSWEEIQSPGQMHNAGYLTALTYDENRDSIQILDVERILGEIIGVEETITEEVIEASTAVDTSGHRILMVDDSKAARALLKNAMDQLNVNYILAESAVRALDIIKKEVQKGNDRPFSLIISDIEMPAMDGFTFTRKMKGKAKLKDIPIILHSSMSNPANRIKAEQVGADDFVPKFRPDEIASAVLNIIDGINKQKQGAQSNA